MAAGPSRAAPAKSWRAPRSRAPTRSALAGAFGLRGAFNELALRLAPGATEPAVVGAVDRLLARYGGVGAYGRKVQVSSLFLDGEIEETQITSVLLPGIFLGVTALLLHIVLSRLVMMQREQIATLKAFGYGNAAVGAHYLALALPLGFAVAYALCWLIAARFDSELFRIPVVMRPLSYLFGAAVVVVSAALSGLAVRGRITRLDLVAVLKTRE